MSNYKTVAEALQWHVRERGEDTPFYVFRDIHGGRQEFTLGRAHLLAGRCAAYLRERGVTKGTRAVVCLDNSPERLVLDLGLLYAGAVPVNGVYQLSDGSDLIHCLRHSRASVVILDPDVTYSPWIPLQALVTRAEDGSVTSSSKHLPDLKRVEFIRRRSQTQTQTSNGKDKEGGGRSQNQSQVIGDNFLADLESQKKEEGWLLDDTVESGDECFVFTTSGTTGMPKLVSHPHRSFVLAMQQWDKSSAKATTPAGAGGDGGMQGVKQDARYKDSHMGTSGGNVTVDLMTRETRLLCDVRAGVTKDRSAFITRCLREERCTKAALVNDDLIAVHSVLTAYTEDSPSGGGRVLEQLSLGAQPVNSKVVSAALQISRSVMLYYGSTELGITSLGLVTDANASSYHDYDVGRPLPGIKVRIVDENDPTTELPAGEIGQVLIKHPLPFTDYLFLPDNEDDHSHPHHQNHPNSQPTTTSPRPSKASTFTVDGYYRTGDRGKMGADGTLTVFGRTGDGVITRGTNVYYPHVLEAAVLECPAVEAVVITGVPDAHFGEEFCACVVLKEGEAGKMKEVEEEVGRKCAASSLSAKPLAPRYFLQFPSLPMLYTGRPDRRSIKRMARERVAMANREL